MDETKLRSGALNLCMIFKHFEIWKSSEAQGQLIIKEYS